jgi:adenosine deaminase
MDLRALPKIELHLHLDCSLSFTAVRALAPSVSRDEYDRDYVAPARCTNLADFLTRAPKGVSLMQTRASLQLVTEDVFGQLLADGVLYAELRFAPPLHLEQALTAGIEACLILCTLRHFSEPQSMATAQLVERFRGARVAALDLAGDEAGYPLDAHTGAYRYARERGLSRTAHAGEGAGPESVWETLRLLAPTRIGHGTRSIEDAALVEHLRRHRIHLELCPSANVQIIPSVAEMARHAADRLLGAGVPLNINTDTRMLTRTTLTGEYEHLRGVFGWGRDEFVETNRMAIEAAFAGDAIKRKLRTVFEAQPTAWAPP